MKFQSNPTGDHTNQMEAETLSPGKLKNKIHKKISYWFYTGENANYRIKKKRSVLSFVTGK